MKIDDVAELESVKSAVNAMYRGLLRKYIPAGARDTPSRRALEESIRKKLMQRLCPENLEAVDE